MKRKFQNPIRVKDKGFALIITVSMLVLMAMVVIGLLSLSTTGLRSTNQRNAELEARANAKMALSIAIAKLQRYAGPDQRITARADMFDGGSTPSPNSPIDGNKMWTGVWSSAVIEDNNTGNFDNDEETNEALHDKKAVWLVSGNDPDTTQSANQQSFNESEVKIATEGKSVFGTENQVAVPRVPIFGDGATLPATGSYGYWVSDESVKARVNINTPDYPATVSDDDDKYFNLVTAQQGDPSLLTYEDSDGNTVRPFISDLSQESTWKNGLSADSALSNQSIPFLSVPGINNDDIKRGIFHHLTAVSEGLLTDAKNGRLKKDLSIAFDRDNIDSEFSGTMFDPVGDSPGEGDPGGPKWNQLKSYFDQSNDGIGTTSISPAAPTADICVYNPVLTRFNMIIQAFAQKKTDESGDLASDYNYVLGMFPTISLWNPYDKEMVFEDLYVEWGQFGGAKLVSRVGGRDSDTTDIATLLRNNGRLGAHSDGDTGANRAVIRFKIEGDSIPPGRVTNYTPPNDSVYGLKSPGDNVLKKGSSGSNIRGFYSETLTDISNSIDFDNLRIEDFSSGKGVVNIHLNDEDYNEDSRILSIDFPVLGKFINRNDNPNLTLRPLELEGRTGAFTFIENQGTSSGADPTQESVINTEDFRSIFGAGNSITTQSPPSFTIRTHAINGTNYISQFNVRSPIISSTPHERGGGIGNNFYQGGRGNLNRAGEQKLDYVAGLGNEFGKIGLSHKGTGNDRMILFQAPTNPILNIGQLMHAPLLNVEKYNTTYDRAWEGNIQTTWATPSYAVGNSYAPALIPLNKTGLDYTSPEPGDLPAAVVSAINTRWKGSHQDYSYELNDVLWDEFYFSGFRNSTNNEFPLPNSRLTKDPSLGNNSTSNYRDSLSTLRVTGMFNVNSTSIEAWTSILGSLRNIDEIGKTPPSTLQHSMSRFPAPFGNATASIPDANNESVYDGYRRLNDDQIRILAQELVDEIKDRSKFREYPFSSLSQFINRSIRTAATEGSETERNYAFRGTIQSAIDKSSINGNINYGDQTLADGEGLWDQEIVQKDIPETSNRYNKDSLDILRNKPILEASSGFLSQADILSKIGSFISVRGDTFTVRAYGSAIDNSGNNVAEAYCEAVVQRTYEFVGGESVDTEASNIPNSSPSKALGRKFTVNSFKWLPKQDI